jgi:hypothetical protein
MAARLWSAGGDSWDVPEAPVRADLRVQSGPREPEAGLLVFLPDGGLVPGRFPIVDARDAAGQPLETALLWHNPAEGVALACAAPAAGDRVRVYLRGASVRPARPAAGALKPGLVLYTSTAANPASLAAAQRLAAEWPPGSDCRCGPVPTVGHRENPFGADDGYISWYAGWFCLERDETIYFATVSDEGSALRIDGEEVVAWPGTHTRAAGAKGEYGRNATLAAGWHRLEYFHFEVDGPQEMTVVWRRGKLEKLPVPLPADALARSGATVPDALVFRDGRRAAWCAGHARAASYLWLGDGPVNLYRLRAEWGQGPAPACLWDFGNGRTVAGSACTWLAVGDAPCTVALVTSNAAGAARLSFSLYNGSPPAKASIGSPAVRLEYREAFLTRLAAAPPGRDPCADWSPDLWAVLLAVMEPYRGGAVLQAIFERGERSLRRLPDADRHALEDRWIECLRRLADTAPLLAAVGRLETTEKDRGRKFHWRTERIAALACDAGDLVAARREAALLREGLSDPDEVQIALVRMGDVERLAGDAAAAARLYGEAQDRYRGRTRPGHAGEGWKSVTLRDAARLATVRSCLAQGAVLEAFAELRQWERESPLAKLSGDYPLAEAQVYARAGDDRRALAALRALRRNVGLNAALPDAMALEWACLERLRRDEDARALAEDIVKRLPGHPLAQRAQSALRQPTRLPAEEPGATAQPSDTL